VIQAADSQFLIFRPRYKSPRRLWNTELQTAAWKTQCRLHRYVIYPKHNGAQNSVNISLEQKIAIQKRCNSTASLFWVESVNFSIQIKHKRVGHDFHLTNKYQTCSCGGVSSAKPKCTVAVTVPICIKRYVQVLSDNITASCSVALVAKNNVSVARKTLNRTTLSSIPKCKRCFTKAGILNSE